MKKGSKHNILYRGYLMFLCIFCCNLLLYEQDLTVVTLRNSVVVLLHLPK